MERITDRNQELRQEKEKRAHIKTIIVIIIVILIVGGLATRSEERRVGKEC